MIRPFKTSTLLLTLGVALAAASPALARPGYDARAEASAGTEISAHRAQSLRECNAASAKTLDYVWGDMQSDQIRACMARHGEVE